MKKLVLILFVLLAVAPTRANNDSLWNVWSNENLEDTTRLAAIYEIIYSEDLDFDPDSANRLTEQMLSFAMTSGNRSYEARAYSTFADIQIRETDYIEGQRDLYKAIEIAKEIDHKSVLEGAYWALGLIYYWMGQHAKCIENYSLSLALREELGKSTSGLLNNIGLIYKAQNDYVHAMEYFQESIDEAQQRGDTNLTALANIADVHSKQGNYTLALEHFQRLIEIYEKNKGRYYDCNMKSAYHSIGKTHLRMNDHERAMDYYMRSLEHDKKDSTCIGGSNYEIDIGSLYEQMGKSELAIEWCTLGHTKSEKMNTFGDQLSACECLFIAYKRKGEDSRALEYLELTVSLNDSLDKEATTKSLQQMEYAKVILADSLKQEEEKLRMRIAHKEEVRKKEKTRNIYLGSGVLLLLLALGLYTRNRFVSSAKARVEKEKDRSDELLLNILPAEIAEELKEKGEAKARDFEMVSILFTDFKGFTQASEKLSAADLVAEINTCFKAFDGIVGKYHIEKIKTIGDSYMCAGGLPVPDENAAKNTVQAGLEMQAFMKARKAERDAAGLPAFEMRVGIHTGPVVAGIVGVKKFQYDIWGDTVNTASRMESSSAVGQVNISQTTYELVKGNSELVFTTRGMVEAKGKGELEMYFVREK